MAGFSGPKEYNFVPESESESSQSQSESSQPQSQPQGESSQPQWQDQHDSEYEKQVQEEKYIVYDSCLDNLLKRCQECGAIITHKEKTLTGAALTVKMECVNHHSSSWSSSPKLGEGNKRSFAINLLLSTVLLTIGGSFTKINNFFRQMRIPFVSQTLYNRYLKNFVYPVIWFLWLKQQEMLLQTLDFINEEIEICGDGRFDSPGFSADLCIYFMICLNLKKVVALAVVHKSQTDNKSTMMEQLGLQTCLHYLTSMLRYNTIARVATDRCINIKALMEDRYPMIDQEYDVWHFIKNIMKDLMKCSKTKQGQPLQPWLKSINNMLWYSFANCDKNPVLLKELYMSIVGHVCNQHSFRKFTILKKCRHGNLEEHRTPWLSVGEYPAQKLIEILKGKDGSRFIALEKMTCGIKPTYNKLSFEAIFCVSMNTFLLESLNNKALVWAPKRLCYPPLSMLIRSTLTAMEWNENVGREQATTKDGTPRFKLEAKFGKKFTVKAIKNENTHEIMDTVRSLVLNCKDMDYIPPVTYPLPAYPERTAKVEKPSKEDAIRKHYTRFKKH